MGDTVARIISQHCSFLARNGHYVDGYLARPVDGEPRPDVVLLSGMFGLAWTQREITRIYARAGFVAISLDFLCGQRPKNRDALAPRQGNPLHSLQVLSSFIDSSFP